MISKVYYEMGCIKPPLPESESSSSLPTSLVITIYMHSAIRLIRLLIMLIPPCDIDGSMYSPKLIKSNSKEHTKFPS